MDNILICCWIIVSSKALHTCWQIFISLTKTFRFFCNLMQFLKCCLNQSDHLVALSSCHISILPSTTQPPPPPPIFLVLPFLPHLFHFCLNKFLTSSWACTNSASLTVLIPAYAHTILPTDNSDYFFLMECLLYWLKWKRPFIEKYIDCTKTES